MVAINSNSMNELISLDAPKLMHKTETTGVPIISILVRVFNEISCLPEFWRRLREQSLFQQTEIIFLDSGSTDGTVEYLMDQPCQLYQIPVGTFNFGRSCNQAATIATTPIMMLLSGHCLLKDKEAIRGVVNALNILRSEALYLRQVPNNIFGCNAYEKAYLVRRFPSGNRPVQMLIPGGFSNAASAFTRVAWEAQKFPEIHGSEDYLWAQAHLAMGGTIYYLPQIEVLHSHAETAEKVYERVRLNAEARGAVGSYGKALFLLAGIILSMMREGSSFREAFRYATYHAKAYM